MSNFVIICPVGAEFYANGQTGRQRERERCVEADNRFRNLLDASRYTLLISESNDIAVN
jgi:hypothetical protein